jgi:hypothetical protein
VIVGGSLSGVLTRATMGALETRTGLKFVMERLNLLNIVAGNWWIVQLLKDVRENWRNVPLWCTRK